MGRDQHIAEHGVALGLQADKGRHGLEPHGLVRAGLHVVEPRQLFHRGRRAIGHEAAHFFRGAASAAGWPHSRSTIQASVLAVVSSPASSIVSTLPAICRSSMPLPSSSAATTMASSRLAECWRRAGSAARLRGPGR
ncbi:hypothetical protein ASF43_02375 [Pseudorhodoferax sp. Leaf267]|nr:hypothetical protein ASF43_02375 [Pseudorhodoferax sp. Leaf267]